MISIEYQSKFISKKDRSKPHYQNSLSLELRFKSGQSIKIPASIGSNSRTEKCLGTNVLILTSQPPPPHQKKMHSWLDAEKTWVQQHTHMKNECLIVLFEQFDIIHMKNECLIVLFEQFDIT